jgi:hypothetical protein
MATYRMADQDVLDMIEELIHKYHYNLHECRVRVGARLAFAAVNEKTGEPKGPAIKHQGYPGAAVVRIVSHKDRVAGMPDAIIDIDGEAWENDWSEERQRAILDHELYHLEVQTDDEGNVKLDDCHRPKLRLKPHDWQLGGFADIAQRHKEAAIEVEAMRQTIHKHGQLLLPF